MKRDTRFFGKEVAFAYSDETIYEELLALYVLEHGGKLAPEYNEASTEVVIEPESCSGNEVVQEAEANGKTVICGEDIIGPEYADKPKDEKGDSEITITLTLEDSKKNPQKREIPAAEKRSQAEGKSKNNYIGAIILVALCALFWWWAIKKLIHIFS